MPVEDPNFRSPNANPVKPQAEEWALKSPALEDSKRLATPFARNSAGGPTYTAEALPGNPNVFSPKRFFLNDALSQASLPYSCFPTEHWFQGAFGWAQDLHSSHRSRASSKPARTRSTVGHLLYSYPNSYKQPSGLPARRYTTSGLVGLVAAKGARGYQQLTMSEFPIAWHSGGTKCYSLFGHLELKT